jgi:hypothetical protein
MTIEIGYKLILKDSLGNIMTTIGQFSRMELARTQNAVGKLDITMPPSFNSSLLKVDGRIEVWRKVGGYDSYLEGECPFIIRDFTQTITNGEELIKVSAYDTMSLLARRYVLYDSESDQANKWDCADDVIKAIARENMGSLATNTSRDISSFLSIQDDTSSAVVIQKACAYKNVLTTMQEIADNAKQIDPTNLLYFDVVWLNETQVQLRTYIKQRGVDHSSQSASQVIAAYDRGNISDPQLIVSYSSEANYVLTAGKGTGAERVTTSSIDAQRGAISPYGRTEYFCDARDVEDIDQLQAMSDSALRGLRPRIAFGGKLVDTDAFLYGIHYKYGDIIAAKYKGSTYDMHIDSTHIIFENGRETKDIVARAEVFI